MATIAVPDGGIRLIGVLGVVDSGVEVAPEVGESFSPIVWVEWSGSDSTKRYWASVDLPDPVSYYGGFKVAKLMTPGPISRSLSDENGEYQTEVFRAEIDDSDYDIRSLLGRADMRRILINTLLVMRMISDTDRRALLTPRTVSIGVVRSYELG